MTLVKPKYITGWGLAPLRLKFGISLTKYLFQRKKYPLFSLKSLDLLKRRQVLAVNKAAKYNNHYFNAIMRVPHYPSRAFDRMVSNGGLNFQASGTPSKIQIDSVILGITRRCSYNCKHCYEHTNIAEKDIVPIERWKDVVTELQKMGVSVIILSGGEPMLRFEELTELLESVDKNLSDFHIHTSGHGVTLDKALMLKDKGLIAAGIGLDDFDPQRHDSFRGYEGAHEEAVQALRHFQSAGLFTYTNICLQGDMVRLGDLWNYLKFVKNLNVGTVLLLEPKPCGGYFSQDVTDLFTEDDRRTVIRFFNEANQKREYKDYPIVSYMAYYESAERFGCMMGGISHFYINSMGDVQPCVFLPVSFGNIMNDSFTEIYRKMREAVPGPLHKQCPSVTFAKTIEAKREQGIALPIPFDEIGYEWNRMFD